ncbi:MAG: hypothetical protein KDD58_14270 [Bdellovibrionales bacterium]|nr:hypothetical protein [Bdellovibrionales bacterium]
MRNKMLTFLMAITLIPSLTMAGDFLTGEEYKLTFCDTTSKGENIKSGWTFNIYINKSCDQLTVHYLTGKEAGKTITRSLTVYPSGDVCIIKNNEEKCEKVKAESNGVYKRYGRKSGYKEPFIVVNSVESGNQL